MRERFRPGSLDIEKAEKASAVRDENGDDDNEPNTDKEQTGSIGNGYNEDVHHPIMIVMRLK